MIDQVFSALKMVFGEHFVSYFILVIGTLYAIHVGIKSIQRWLVEEVLKPYLQPLIEKVDGNINMVHGHNELLVDHEDRLRIVENREAILEGKILGGRIKDGLD